MLLSLLINTAVVMSCVFIHYGFLAGISYQLDKLPPRRLYLLAHVFSGLIAHILEIFVFAVAYFFQLKYLQVGSLEGDFNGSFLDCFYFSFTSYTSLGFGDIEPEGWLRFTAGIEALLGLMMITWTASLLYLAMQQQWAYDIRRV